MEETISPTHTDPAPRGRQGGSRRDSGHSDLPLVVPPPSAVVILGAFLAVGLLAALDTMEHVPAISVYLPESIRVYEVYDLLALGVIFGAARSFSRGSLIGLAALFILLHVPG